MNFQVVWEPESNRDLHLAWVFAKHPIAVHDAKEEADQLLAGDPSKCGVHVSEGLWSVILPPIRLQYTFDSAKRVVTIVSVALLAGHQHP